jgi:segregation and condensation protein A
MRFRVELDVFRGPLDLLLYLVRRQEVEISEIPIATITEQFLAHVEVLKELSVDAVGEFLELASTLLEIKSRELLPRAPEEEEQPAEELRQDLVRRLLEYKRFRDAASMLEERGRAWQQRFVRQDLGVGTRPRNLAEEPIREAELWDLVSAFGRLMREIEAGKPASIVYDDTPIHVYIERILARLKECRRLPFASLFQGGMHKSTLVGLFLAVLELVRHHGVIAEQAEPFGEIWLLWPAPQADGEAEPPRSESEPAAAPARPARRRRHAR